MTWETTATDGKAIGKPDFLRDYWLPQQQECQCVPAPKAYEIYSGKITAIRPETFDHDFDEYDITSQLGTATLILRKELKPTVKMILDLKEEDSLEGAVVKVFYRSRSISGFMKLE
jgi:hypothetical protein